MTAKPAIVVAGTMVRVLAPKWAHRPLSGDGAAKNGGRFNTKGTRALYLSYDLDVAHNEYNQDLGTRAGTFCYYQVDLKGIADLSSRAVLSKLGIRHRDLFTSWKDAVSRGRTPPTWTITKQLRTAGFIGARYQSVLEANRRPRRSKTGLNLVVWKWSNAKGRRITVIDPKNDLPRNQRSWPR